jgi:hypothetical protein
METQAHPQSQSKEADQSVVSKCTKQSLAHAIWNSLKNRFSSAELLIIGSLCVQVATTWASGLPLIMLQMG